MAITDKRVVKFSNEVVRPLAEQIRDLYYRCKDAQVQWFGGLNALTINDANEKLADAREVEGVSSLSGADLNNMMTTICNHVTAIEKTGVLDIVSKPCVRSVGV